MRDLDQLELGQAVDYVIEYNDLHKLSGKEADPKREEPSVRQATQADWDAFWG